MKLMLIWNIIITLCLMAVAIALVCLNARINEASQGVQTTEQVIIEIDNTLQNIVSGLTAAEQYLEPEYQRYLRGEISALWQAVEELRR